MARVNKTDKAILNTLEVVVDTIQACHRGVFLLLMIVMVTLSVILWDIPKSLFGRQQRATS